MFCSGMHLLAMLAIISCFKATPLLGSSSDCWSLKRLNQMKMNSEQAKDPKFAQFHNMFKCLQEEQGGTGFNNPEWQKFPNSVSGNNDLFNIWNVQKNRPPPSQDWSRPGSNLNYNQNVRPNNVQPVPGVHPDDWARDQRPPWPDANNNNNYPPKVWPTQRGSGQNDKINNSVRNRSRNEHRRNRGQRRRKEDVVGQGSIRLRDNSDNIQEANGPSDLSNNGVRVEDNRNPNLGQMNRPDTDKVFIDEQESSMISRKRKYGYAIMALAVVALAILMVTTIFCCNSSTTSQQNNAAAQQHQVGDTYSIYSYKQGAVEGSDTLRSGNLGDTLRTQTLLSTQSRASPQYRVSDIDPEYSRRFREDNQHHY